MAKALFRKMIFGAGDDDLKSDKNTLAGTQHRIKQTGYCRMELQGIKN